MKSKLISLRERDVVVRGAIEDPTVAAILLLNSLPQSVLRGSDRGSDIKKLLLLSVPIVDMSEERLMDRNRSGNRSDFNHNNSSNNNNYNNNSSNNNNNNNNNNNSNDNNKNINNNTSTSSSTHTHTHSHNRTHNNNQDSNDKQQQIQKLRLTILSQKACSFRAVAVMRSMAKLTPLLREYKSKYQQYDMVD